MPVAYLDLPSGLEVETKKKLVKEVAESIHHAYMIPDTRVFLREWPAEQMSVDGLLGAPIILLTGYLGGAVATHVRAGEGLFPILFPIILGMLLWGGIYLRDERLRALVPIGSGG